MTFKVILLALKGLKFIDVTTNFRPFYSKKKNKICLSIQTLKVTGTSHGKIIGERGAVFIYQ